MSNVAEGHTLVRCDSNRGRRELYRIVPGAVAYYSWESAGHWYAVPDDSLAEVLLIKGVRKSQPRCEVLRCWK